MVKVQEEDPERVSIRVSRAQAVGTAVNRHKTMHLVNACVVLTACEPKGGNRLV
jgi:hypothetical protein